MQLPRVRTVGQLVAAALMLLSVLLLCTWARFAIANADTKSSKSAAPKQSTSGPDPSVPEWVNQAHPPRRAQTNAEVRAVGNKLQYHVDHKIIVMRDDPILSTVNGPNTHSSDIAKFIIGAVTEQSGFGDVAYGPATATYGPGDSTAIIALAGDAELNYYSQYNEIALTAIPIVSGKVIRFALVESDAIELRAVDVVISAVPKGTAVRRSADQALFEGAPAEVSATVFANPPPNNGLSASGPRLSSALFGLGVSWLPYWLLSIAVPWIVLFLAGSRVTDPVRRYLRSATFAVIILLVLNGLMNLLEVGSALSESGSTVILFSAALTLVPVAATVWLRQVRRRNGWASKYVSLLWVLSAVALGGTILARYIGGSSTQVGVIVGAGFGVVTSSGIAGALLPRVRRSVPESPLRSGIRRASLGNRLRWAVAVASVGAGLYSVVIASAAPIGLLTDGRIHFVLVIAAGLLWFPALASLLNLSQRSRPKSLAVIAAVFAAVLWLPPIQMIFNPRSIPDGIPLPGLYPFSLTLMPIWLANSALFVLLVALLRRRNYARALGEPIVRAACLALIAEVCIPPFGAVTAWGLAAPILAAVGLGWLLQRGKAGIGVRLANVSPAAHSRLVRAEVWRRLVKRSADEHHRTLKSALSSGETTISAAREAQNSLDEAGSSYNGLASRGADLASAALSSGGGNPPWNNGVAAAGVGALLACPLVIYELVTANDYGADWVEVRTYTILELVRPLMAWVVYGGAFGYLYPIVRGNSPMRKAWYLFIAAVPVQLCLVLELHRDNPTVITVAANAGIVVGQSIVFALGLGLYWEWRLSHAAGISWGRLRDFRSFGALLAPASTILVAAATATATALVALLLQPSQVPSPKVPETSPSASSTARQLPPTPRPIPSTTP